MAKLGAAFGAWNQGIQHWAYLQVRGIGQQGQVDSLPRDGGAVIGCAQVVLDIPSALTGRHHTRELAEDLAHWLPDHIRQYIEAACMRGALCPNPC